MTTLLKDILLNLNCSYNLNLGCSVNQDIYIKIFDTIQKYFQSDVSAGYSHINLSSEYDEYHISLSSGATFEIAYRCLQNKGCDLVFLGNTYLILTH